MAPNAAKVDAGMGTLIDQSTRDFSAAQLKACAAVTGR